MFDATNLDHRARMSHSRWNQSTIKPAQNITESSEEPSYNEILKQEEQRQRGDKRNTAKMPTIDLSAESDSDISIERVVKQIAKNKPEQKRKGKQQKRDTLIFQMEQKL